MTWSGITFSYTTWRQPSLPGGYVDTQSAVIPQYEPLGAVRITNGSKIVFSECTFSHLGGPYALSISNASQYATVTGCRFNDLSGGAVKLGNVDDTRAVTKDPSEMDRVMLLEQCILEDIAVEFHGASAVFAGYVSETTITQNTIRRTGYTGIRFVPK